MKANISTLPRDLQTTITDLVQKLQNPNPPTTFTLQQRNETLYRLWELSNKPEIKLPLCDPKLGFLTLLVAIITNENDNYIGQFNATGTIWYISRELRAKPYLCSPSLGLIPALMKLTRRDVRLKEHIVKALSNCSLSGVTHNYLLLPEFGYLEYLKELLIEFPDDSRAYQSIHCVISEMKNEHAMDLIRLGIHEILMTKLVSFGTNPHTWHERWSGTVYWCLNFIVGFSPMPCGNKALYELHQEKFFMELVKVDLMEGIKAALVIANLLGKDDNNNLSGNAGIGSTRHSLTQSLLESYPRILPILVKLYSVTLDCDNTKEEVKELRKSGFAYGIIKLSDITCALKNLSISDKNKSIMLANTTLLTLVMKTIQLFIDDAPECSSYETYTMEYAGGGGKDFITMENCLELLLQLSFYYEEDSVLQSAWIVFDEIYSPKLMFQQLVNLPESRNLPFEVKQYSVTLHSRFQPKPVIKPLLSSPLKSTSLIVPNSVVDSSSVPQQQHVMLSYAWTANKPYVVALANKLRELGYDVWRDEDGSSLVPSMSGDIIETTTAAIKHSYAVIICVSPEYKENANCRIEAKYASEQGFSGGELKLIYVLMDKCYATNASGGGKGRILDGWLGAMVGKNPCYPLWEESQIPTTANIIAGILGDRARINPISGLIASNDIPFAAEAKSSKENRSSPDYASAWGCLDPKKSYCPKTLMCFMEEMGIYSAEDLQNLDQDHLQLLALSLKAIPQKIFRKSLQL